MLPHHRMLSTIHSIILCTMKDMRKMLQLFT